MTLFLKNWTLASFSLTVLSSPYWPWMPPLGFALFCPLFMILSIKLARFRIGDGIVLALLVIITHSNTVKTQSSSIFQAGQDITIKGKVDSFFKPNSYGYEGSVVVNQINGQSIRSIFPSRIQLYSPIPMQVGDEFEFISTLKPVIGRLNETGFDLESYSMSQRLVARGMVKTGTPFKVFSKPSVRGQIYDRVLSSIVDSSYRGMIMALVFGERSGITQSQWQQFRDSGLTHLIAISGLHIGIAFGIGFMLGAMLSRVNSRLLWLPFVLGVLSASSYAWLAGFSLPTQRALVMCLANVLIIFSRVHVSAFQRILITLAAVLTFDPFASLASSFWLSFSAVCFVLYLIPITQSMTKWRRIIYSQLMLVLLMTPVGIYFFGGVSWTSVLFNLLFIPWFSFIIVPATFVAVISSLASLPISSLLWSLVGSTFYPLDLALEQTVSGWLVVSDSFQMLVLALLVIWVMRSVLSWYSLSLFTFICLGWFGFSSQKPESEWRMDVLDVGHGLAALIEKDGQFLLYDTGSSWPKGSYVSSLIAPLIAKRGKSSINTVIYSHLDDDHAGGRNDVESLLSPKFVYASEPLGNSDACVRGQKWRWQDLDFTVLWPPKMVKRAYNQHSCVIRIADEQYGHTVLLSGDITAVGEWLLARGGVTLQSDIMIVPHHGSKTSSTSHFIQRVDPDVAIASLAKGNRWKLPDSDVVQRYRNQGVKWLDTGDAGQVTLQYRAESRHLSTLRHDGISPWYRQMLRKGVE